MRLSFIAILLTIAMLLCGQAWADKTYTVRKGDSLYLIAKKFKTGIDAISTANGLASDKLVPGTKLTIPLKASEKKHPAVVKPVSAEQNNIQAGPKTYKVKRGDTLGKIAKKYSISVDELKKFNNLTSNKIGRGQMLVLEQPPVETEAIAAQTMQGNILSAEIEKVEGADNTNENRQGKLQDFLTFITRQTIGIPYRFGSNTFKGTDCSGYVQKVFSLAGISLPRSAREQFHRGEPVKKEDLSIGDLVFFRTYASFPSHVGIYLGNDLFIHASTLAKKVTVDRLDMPYYIKRFIGAKRLPGLSEIDLENSGQAIEKGVN